jgi:hypothetical protein
MENTIIEITPSIEEAFQQAEDFWRETFDLDFQEAERDELARED